MWMGSLGIKLAESWQIASHPACTGLWNAKTGNILLLEHGMILLMPNAVAHCAG